MRQRSAVRGLSAAALAILAGTLLLAVPAALPTSLARDAAPGIDPSQLYARVMVIGASASAGFGVRPPPPRTPGTRGEPMTIAALAGASRLGAADVEGDATALFFMNPPAIGTAQVDAVLARSPRPTIVFACDFLFWFTYGALAADRTPISDEAQRLALLERGLALVDRIAAAGIPVVVGDIPDMSAAVGRMLSRAQMPRPETLDRANALIAAWAAARPLVAVMPLSSLTQELRQGRPFRAGRREWSEQADGPLIQRDQLHPTFAGSIALIARTEQAANERFLGIRRPNAPGAPAAFEHDPAKVAESMRAAAAGVPDGAPRQPLP